jgi:hypothetical protein
MNNNSSTCFMYSSPLPLFSCKKIRGSKLILTASGSPASWTRFFAPHGAGVNEEPKRSRDRRKQETVSKGGSLAFYPQTPQGGLN